MARAALGRALVATGGTMLGLGAATMVVSTVSMAVTRTIVQRRKAKFAVACNLCRGKKRLRCDVCAGTKVIRYHPYKQSPVNARTEWTACAMCSATGQQKCLNCLGEGLTYPT
eukprot:jgi/Chrzof1/11960/Cz06g16050.t1